MFFSYSLFTPALAMCLTPPDHHTFPPEAFPAVHPRYANVHSTRNRFSLRHVLPTQQELSGCLNKQPQHCRRSSIATSAAAATCSGSARRQQSKQEVLSCQLATCTYAFASGRCLCGAFLLELTVHVKRSALIPIPSLPNAA